MERARGFAILAPIGAITFNQVGIGHPAAILIDATITRGVLLPAATKPLGDWNWYLPRSLRRLPRVGGEQEARTVGA